MELRKQRATSAAVVAALAARPGESMSLSEVAEAAGVLNDSTLRKVASVLASSGEIERTAPGSYALRLALALPIEAEGVCPVGDAEAEMVSAMQAEAADLLAPSAETFTFREWMAGQLVSTSSPKETGALAIERAQQDPLHRLPDEFNDWREDAKERGLL